MKTLLTILGLAATCCVSSGSIYVTNSFYNPANGHNYYLLSPGMWTDEEAFAQTLGGHLLTINDATENTWVLQNILSLNSDLNPWFGWNDSNADDVWTWSSGEAVTFINWGSGEPNFLELGHRYGNLFETGSPPGFPGKWNNAPNVDILFAIAEVPEPSAAALGLLSVLGFAVRRIRRKS